VNIFPIIVLRCKLEKYDGGKDNSCNKGRERGGVDGDREEMRWQ